MLEHRTFFKSGLVWSRPWVGLVRDLENVRIYSVEH